MNRPGRIHWPLFFAIGGLFTYLVYSPRAWERLVPPDLAVRSSRAGGKLLAPRAPIHRAAYWLPAQPSADWSLQGTEHRVTISELMVVCEPAFQQPNPMRPMVYARLASIPETQDRPAAPPVASDLSPPDAPGAALISADSPELESALHSGISPSNGDDHDNRLAWPSADSLRASIDRACACGGAAWASRATAVLGELTQSGGVEPARAQSLVTELTELASPTHSLLRAPSKGKLAGDLERARHSLARRLGLWQFASASFDQDMPEGGRCRLDLLHVVEQFESNPLASTARELVSADQQHVDDAGRPENSLGPWLHANYRKANLRIAVTTGLLNRLLPQQPAREGRVNDSILGVPTRGWSRTTAKVNIRPIRDPRRLRFHLEARGNIAARTSSTSGPATFFSDTDSEYLGRKMCQFDAQGLRAWPAEVDATNQPRLRRIRTDFDSIPLLGDLVESFARARHDESQSTVRGISRRKISQRVKQEFDAQVDERLAASNARLKQQVFDPLAELGLKPDIVEMHTTAERFTVRTRLAADDQLAANTPRPRAPAESLASVQLHQSLVNNLIGRLGLDGRQFTLSELQQHFAAALRLPPEAFTEPFPENMRITFANDAVRTRFDEGRVELTLAIAELRNGPRVWRDFVVRIYYRPQTEGLNARLVRDGHIQLQGKRSGGQLQLALRGIFSRIFSPDRTVNLVTPPATAMPRLAGLHVAQFVIVDGWIGLAIDDTTAPRTARVAQAPRRAFPHRSKK